MGRTLGVSAIEFNVMESDGSDLIRFVLETFELSPFFRTDDLGLPLLIRRRREGGTRTSVSDCRTEEADKKIAKR